MQALRLQTRSAMMAALIVAACAPVDAVTNKNTAGQPAEYRDGFREGCGSGYVAAGHPYAKFSKDVMRFQTDSLYKQGWEDGHSVCKGSYSSMR